MVKFPNPRVVNFIEYRRHIAIMGVLSVVLCAPACAADFSKAKQIYAPPTLFSRPANYESSREMQSRSGNTGRHPAPVKLSAQQLTKLRLKAETLIKRGDLNQASQLLNQCFAAQSGNLLVQNDLLKVNLSRSRRYEQSKKLDQAITASREAIYFSPNNTTAIALLTRQLKKKGIDAGNANVRLALAQKLSSAGKLPEALVEYCQSYKLKPSAAACAGLGKVYQAAGKTKLAEQQYNLALQLDPGSVEANRQLGLLHLAAGDIVAANSNLGKALEADGKDTVASKALTGLWEQQVSRSPNSANAHLGLARAYQLSGKLNLARNEYDTVAAIEPNNPTLPVARASLQRATAREQSVQAITDARSLETQGSLEQAKNRLGAALADDPKNTEMLLLQGELLEKMGKTGDAADAYQAVLYADPNNTEAVQRLKNLSEGKSNFDMIPDSTMILPTGSDVAKLSNFVLDLRKYVDKQQKEVKTARREAGKPKS